MAKYKWEGRLPGNAQECGEELERLQQENKGTITPKIVVETARDPESPLHRCFEWRDDVAAEKYREDQARDVIRSIRVVHESVNGRAVEPSRVFINFDAVEGQARTYVTVDSVMQDAELFERARLQLLRESAQMRDRYRSFVKLHTAIVKMQEEVEHAAPVQSDAVSPL